MDAYEDSLLSISRMQREAFARKTTMYWEDRLTPEQHAKMNEALKAFKKHKNSHRLYDDLCNSGMTSEEADEYCNLMEGGD